MILGKYKSKRKLGKGAYGEVLLVQDNAGKLFALKLITMKSLLKESYLLDYLEGEIECMKSLNSPYLMKLEQDQEDQNFKYLICEYCDGGDLLNYQAKQPGKVFTLERATQILSEVIRGLYDLHRAGYLHRDIKSQNVLVKSEKGKQTFKLADFGFSKKNTEVDGTVLGTQNYMSPEIYRNQVYGFEVDMWAFGVLFYFMLNMEFPFKINPMAPLQKKQEQLINLTKNFSYQKLVKLTKKKLFQNCTPEVQDLFSKIFNPNGDDRISFGKIRQHPLFSKYFPQNNADSTVLYKSKFQSSQIIKKGKQNKKKASQKQQNTNVAHQIIKPKDEKFPKEKTTLERKKDQIDFLRENSQQFFDRTEYFKLEQRCSLSFNLLKYYIILLREFIGNLNPTDLGKLYPKMAWAQFCKTNAFKDIKKQAQEDEDKAVMKFDELYHQCSFSLKQIQAINNKFKAAYDKDIKDTQFDGAFKQSYRKSTHTSFNTLRSLIKTAEKSGNKLNFNLAIIVISHVFNHIFQDSENVGKIFQDYFVQRKRNIQNIDYSELREWMTKASAGQLNSLAKQTIQLYFA